ncbi:MAG: transcription termination factor NusA [Lachnospiraceae bacterium]|nr:transcription termination factor NusA [Lachnospiraceae bacterium]
MATARRKTTAKAAPTENSELILALEMIEKEKGIPKAVMLETIQNSLITAYKNEYGKAENARVTIDEKTGIFKVYSEKEVVEVVEDEVTQISKAQAEIKMGQPYEIGDVVSIEVTPKDFGRIAAQKAKQVVVQKIREEERNALFSSYAMKEKDIVTGVIERFQDPDRGNYNIVVSLGKLETILPVTEQIKGEEFYKNERVKLYVTKVENNPKGPRVSVSRTHPELVKRLFEEEVTEIADGIVEIKGISREAGQRTKISVYSHDTNVDPVGACVGVNGARVNAIVEELHGEKIDIIVWSEDPAVLIENSLSPAKVVSVTVEPEEKTARVIVPDYQLSLAIGREGQNARLAAKLTGFRIDIKSESQNDGTYTDNGESFDSFEDNTDAE